MSYKLNIPCHENNISLEDIGKIAYIPLLLHEHSTILIYSLIDVVT